MNRATIEHILKAYGGHFTYSELLTQPENLCKDTLIKLLEFRQWHGYPMLITSAFRPGDTKAHGKGKAFDVIIFEKGKFQEQTLSAAHQYRLAEVFGWRGIGLYYDWKLTYKNGKTEQAFGIHVDQLPDTTKRPLRWIRENGNYHYLNLVTGQFGNHLLWNGFYEEKKIG